MKKITRQRLLPGFIEEKATEDEVEKKCEEISTMDFIAFFLENGAIGKNLIINLVHPVSKQFKFIIKKIEVENANYIDDRILFSSGDLNSSTMIGTILIGDDCGETLIFYMLEDCFYFMNQKEISCEQCSANGYPGADCPFHMDKMIYHCPCSVSIELEEKILVVKSDIAEI